jgi:hypothetical protein
MAAGSPPDYDNVRMIGPQGLRIPTEQGKATFALKYHVALNVGGAGVTNTINLPVNQTLGSDYVVTNAGSGATTVVWPGSFPGHFFVVYNNSGQACTFKVTGQNGISVANSMHAILVDNGTDIARVTADT